MTTTPQTGATASGASPADQDALPAGSRLGEFEIVRVLGAGGFGIVYLALDQVLLRHVAIKEYMPAALAARGHDGRVVARAGAPAERFAIGLASFIDEARLLASFDHPSLVKVHRFWQAGGTAYMAMPYYPGQTLKDARRQMTDAPDERWLRGFVEPLLGALEALHAQGVYHRDIAPDNILLLPDGQPVLLDFGSARRVIGDQTQSLTAILKPNFAPIEQYGDEAGMRQGPYTDLYALGATMHFVIVGHAPPPAAMRAVRDILPLLAEREPSRRAGVSREFLAALDWSLALASTDRPQTVDALRQALAGVLTPPPPTPRHEPVDRSEPVDRGTACEPVTGALEPTRRLERGTRPNAEPAPAARRPPGVAGFPLRRAVPVLAAGLCALGVGAWAIAQRPAASEPAAAPAAAATPARVAATIGVAPVAPEPTAAAARDEGIVPSGVPTRTTAAKPNAASPEARVAAAGRPVAEPSRSSVAGAPPSAPTRLCADLGFFAATACLSRACQAPALRSHPQCTEVRRVEEQRLNRMEQ